MATAKTPDKVKALEDQLESALNKSSMLAQQAKALQNTVQSLQARIFQLEMEIVDRDTRLMLQEGYPPSQ